MPFVIDQQGDATPLRGGEQVKVNAIGDIRGFAKVLVASAPGLGVSLAVDASYHSSRAADSFAGDAKPTVRPMLIFGVGDDAYGASVNVGYRVRGHSEVANLIIDDELTAGLGVKVRAVPDRLWLIGEGYLAAGIEDGDNDSPAEVLGGLRLLAGPVTVQAGAGAGVTRGYGAPAFRALVTFAYSSRRDRDDATRPPADRDLDGVVDASDACVDQPEDRDGFRDDDGCAELDNDEDGTADLADNCTLEAGPAENRGCPDLDRDADALLDRLDQCPVEAEDVDGYLDADGCPEPDNDDDGRLDAADACPIDPEDLDRFEDEDGCPERDNDADGFVDAVDGCPGEAEVFNGNQDDDGCPDPGKALADFTAEKIVIREQVHFASNKATIKKTSYRLLAAVAKLLELHDEVTRVRIEGHTDTTGKRAKNLALSQQRADAVKQHLVDVHGLDAARLDAVGFGPDAPIGDNETRGGRALNRRVEFIIVEQKSPKVVAP
jgi:outer membrane protein OmpA-like peptidoglycan-associated protein